MADTFGNSLFGTCHHIVHGKVVFRDEKNQLTGVLDVGSVRNRPRDCFEGWIEKDGVKVCERITGTYMGHADFDGERYFDIREMDNYELTDLPTWSKDPLCLASDSRKRLDLVELHNGNKDLAQENKHALEVVQRKDRKLREAAEKRRKEGGAKIVYHFEKEEGDKQEEEKTVMD